jgi:hypothetical protein
MAALVFWGAIILIVIFINLTTRAERREMWSTFWVVIVLLGAFGFVWQFLRQGTLSS